MGQPRHDVLETAETTSGAAHDSGTHDVAPGAASIEPEAQEKAPTRHDDCVASGYEPAGHASHDTEPPGAYDVAAQRTQADADVAPMAAEAVPESHCGHDDMPWPGP